MIFEYDSSKEEKTEFVQTLVEGIASGKVTKYEESEDKNGNPRTTIYIDAIQNGKNGLAKDFISKKQGWKLKNLAKSSGDDNLSNKIEKKENVIYSDVVGLVFNFIVKLNGTYANVGKYVPRSAEDIVKNSSKKPEEFNDDIPF